MDVKKTPDVISVILVNQLPLEKNVGKDSKSHIYKSLQENCQNSRINFDCYQIIDRPSSYLRLQIKVAKLITRKILVLNKHVKR